ncbi:MAG TPA: hypothetical protein VM324_00390 [Egibacteraceae bacterium]|nr:hypothetical protein [Egibacteraceae bacterium]
MDRDKLRSILDNLDEEELLELRATVEQTPDGSQQEIEGMTATKEEALLLINQAMVMDNS